MSCHDAYYLLHDVLNNIFLNYQEYLSFQLNNNVPVGIGSTISNLDEGVISVNIGIKEIPDVKNQNVTDYNFMLCLVGIYHEYRHVQQFFEIFHQDRDLGRYLTMNYFAEYENNEYCCKNYWLNPKELDAQYFGLVRAYQYCEAQFGHDEAERLLCNYQNTRIRNGKKTNGLYHRYYQSRFESIADMDLSIEMVFREAMLLERGRELDAKFGNMITSDNQYDDDIEKE